MRKSWLITAVLAFSLSPALVGCAEKAATNLSVGDCFTISPGQESLSTVKVQDCSTEHNAEVFANTEVTDKDLPAEEELEQRAQDYCIGQFATYVGVEPTNSSLDILFMHPDEKSWGSGDRLITCITIPLDPDEKVTASFKDSKR